MCPLDGPPAIIRAHPAVPAPGFKALTDDPLLKQYRVILEIGEAKNRSQKPVAERAM